MVTCAAVLHGAGVRLECGAAHRHHVIPLPFDEVGFGGDHLLASLQVPLLPIDAHLVTRTLRVGAKYGGPCDAGH